MMCETGRFRLRRDQHEDRPPLLAWDDGPAWEFWLEVKPSPGGRYVVLEGSLRRPTTHGVVEQPPAADGGNGQAAHAANADRSAEPSAEPSAPAAKGETTA